MTSAMTAFVTAVGATALVCYALMTRLENRRRDRRSAGDGSPPDTGNPTGDAWTLLIWFGSAHSAFDSSGNSVDSGGFGDFGGGGDGDGGGGSH